MSAGRNIPSVAGLQGPAVSWLKRLRLPTRLGLNVAVLGAFLICVCAAGLAAALRHAGDYLVIDEPKPSDVIVVLDGDDGSRLPRAIELLQSGVAPELILDADAQHRWLGRTEADEKLLEIASLGDVAGRVRVCPIEAASTAGESKAFSKCIRHLPIHRILIVTSAYHSRRALATFSRALPQYQWSVASSKNAEKFGTEWWTRGTWASTTFHEWEKLIWWQAVDRWLV